MWTGDNGFCNSELRDSSIWLSKKQKFLPFILWLHFQSVVPGLGLSPLCLSTELVFALGTRINDGIHQKYVQSSREGKFPNLLCIIRIL